MIFFVAVWYIIAMQISDKKDVKNKLNYYFLLNLFRNLFRSQCLMMIRLISFWQFSKSRKYCILGSLGSWIVHRRTHILSIWSLLLTNRAEMQYINISSCLSVFFIIRPISVLAKKNWTRTIWSTWRLKRNDQPCTSMVAVLNFDFNWTDSQ